MRNVVRSDLVDAQRAIAMVCAQQKGSILRVFGEAVHHRFTGQQERVGQLKNPLELDDPSAQRVDAFALLRQQPRITEFAQVAIRRRLNDAERVDHFFDADGRALQRKQVQDLQQPGQCTD